MPPVTKRPRGRAKRPTDHAGAIQKLHAAQAILRRYPNVLGIGLGFERKHGQLRGAHVAFVVHVTRKRNPRKDADRLPSELFGIPVDVVERRQARVRSFDAGSFVAPSSNTADYGHLGLIARDSQGQPIGLTVAHVARPGSYPVKAATNTAGDPMSCWDQASDPALGGTLVEAHFDAGQDIARVKIAPAAGNSFDPSLDGQGQAGRPRTVTALTSPPLAVKLVVPGMDWPDGTLAEIGHAGEFDTKSEYGSATFNGLLQFEFPGVKAVRDGWSGSLICDASNAPIALLSFGGTVQTHAGEPPRPTGWGWPIAPNYNFWGLSPL